jgi:hypothetical protein
MVQTPGVEELNVTGKLEVTVADNIGVVPKFLVPGFAKVIVWVAWLITKLPPDAPVTAE